MFIAKFQNGIHVGYVPIGYHSLYDARNLLWVDHFEYSTPYLVAGGGCINTIATESKKGIAMALDTNNNFTVAGYTAQANIATDYSLSETSHFQVMKMAFGSTAEEPIRVTDSSPLPVTVQNTPSVTATVNGTVSVNGSVSVYGIAGATAIGVTASDLDIRSLTAGDPTVGLAPGADFVRVVGYSGGYPIGVSASNFGIRSLTAGVVTEGTVTGADFVRVVGVSGAYPVGITATNLDIRGLSATKDSIRVLGGVTVTNGEGSPWSFTGYNQGFQTRLLRATRVGDPATNTGVLSAYLGSGDGSVEDTVRVVGLSGAYPVDAVLMGLTSISDRTTRKPLHIDDSGALYVALAAGTIGVTATISSSSFTLSGISLIDATAATQTIQIRGYTGNDTVPVGITAAGLDIRKLSTTTDSIYANTRILGSSGSAKDLVDMNGTGGVVMASLNKALFDVTLDDGTKAARIRTDDVNAALIWNGGLAGICGALNTIATPFLSTNAYDATNSRIKVSVENVAQPNGITSGKINVAVGSAAQITATSTALKSGVHLKTNLSATNATVFILSSNSPGNGYPLFNGDQIFIETDNLNRIWVSAEGAGATLYYIAT